jgi:hypothetical protein
MDAMPNSSRSQWKVICGSFRTAFTPGGRDRGSHGGAHARPRVDNDDGKTVGIAAF